MSNPLFCLFCLFNAVFKCPLRSRPLSLPRLKGRLDLWPFCHWRGLSQASYRREPRMKPLSCSQGPSLQLLCMACLTTFEYMGDISKIESSLGFFSLQTHASAELTVQIFWNSRDTLSICPLFHPITKSSPSRPVYIRCFEDSEAEAEGRSLCWPRVWCAG